MTKSIIVMATAVGDSRAAGATVWDRVAEGVVFYQADEAAAQVTYRHAGVFSDIYYRILTNATTAASTVTFNVNGTNGNMTLSIGIGAVGEFVEASPNTDTIASADLVVIEFVVGTGGAIVPVMCSVVFAPSTSSNTVTRLHNANIEMTSASSTRYTAIGSGSLDSTTESQKQFSVQVAGTLKNLEDYSLSIRATSTTARTRVGAGNGALTFAITGTAPLRFEDTTHSDTIAADDLINTQFITGTGSDTLSLREEIDFISTNGDTVFFATNGSAVAGTLAFTKNATRYVPLSDMETLVTTESTTQMKMRVGSGDGTVTFKLLRANITANSVTVGVNCTINLRANAGSLGNSISVAGGATGVLTDITHTDTISATTDEVNYRVVNPDSASGTHTLTVRYIAIVMNIVAPAAATARPMTRAFNLSRYLNMNLGNELALGVGNLGGITIPLRPLQHPNLGYWGNKLASIVRVACGHLFGKMIRQNKRAIVTT